MALLIAALTQGVSSYYYEPQRSVRTPARRGARSSRAAALRRSRARTSTRPTQLVSALRVEPNVEEALLIDSNKRVLMHYAGSKTMLMAQQPARTRRRSSTGSRRRSRATQHQHRFDGLTALHLVYPITDEGKLIGHLYVRANLVGAAGGDRWSSSRSCSAAPCIALALRLSTRAARAAPDRVAAAEPGRDDAGRRARRLLAGARDVTSRRRDRPPHARLQRACSGKIENREQELAQAAGASRGAGGGAHQEPGRGEPHAAPGDERQRRGLPHRRSRVARQVANSSRACRTRSARP